MPFQRPTLQQLIARGQADAESRLPGTDPRLAQSFLGALLRAQAGATHGLYGALDHLSRQVLPTTAETDILDEHARWWGVARNPAAAATGTVTFAGTNGVTIPAGTAVQRADGTEYTTDAAGEIAAGSADIAVTASAGGQAGNADAGTALSLVSPIAGVQSSATVAAGGLTGGTDIETDAALRERLRLRVQNQPQGGAKTDYETWALEVAGVTRVWVLPGWLGIGTVGVAFVRDDDDDPIPDAAEVTAVQDYIDDRRPVTADVTVFAPTAAAVAMTISLAPNTAAVQAAVQAELSDLIRREAAVEDGTGSGTILVSHIREAISLADGETDHDLVTPAADVALNSGEIAVLGTITWQAL